MRIYNDENGKAIDYLAERNEEIKEKLEKRKANFVCRTTKRQDRAKETWFSYGVAVANDI